MKDLSALRVAGRPSPRILTDKKRNVLTVAPVAFVPKWSLRIRSFTRNCILGISTRSFYGCIH